tara:strand:+ start:964 stop:1503 length:540 start_codon:yes stop_codon:yes gene_type:complete
LYYHWLHLRLEAHLGHCICCDAGNREYSAAKKLKNATLIPYTNKRLQMLAGFFRVRYEIQFEAMNQAVFAESSKFAAEAIGAFRTVTGLTMEEMIARRYEFLLQDHVKKAFIKARWSTFIFAASDSVQLLCMALAFWYGGRLLASREYDAESFFVVYSKYLQLNMPEDIYPILFRDQSP